MDQKILIWSSGDVTMACHEPKMDQISNECKRYSMAQATKAVQLSRKMDLIDVILAHTSIHDMLGLDSLTPFPQVHTSYKETLLIVHPDKNNGVAVPGESQAFQKVNEIGRASCRERV